MNQICKIEFLIDKIKNINLNLSKDLVILTNIIENINTYKKFTKL